MEGGRATGRRLGDDEAGVRVEDRGAIRRDGEPAADRPTIRGGLPLVAEGARDSRRLAKGLLAMVALGVFLWLGSRTMKLADRLPGRGLTTVDQSVIVERT